MNDFQMIKIEFFNYDMGNKKSFENNYKIISKIKLVDDFRKLVSQYKS